VFGLTANGRLPFHAKPGEIFIDGLLELRPATGPVDILDAQQTPAARRLGRVIGDQRRIGVTEM